MQEHRPADIRVIQTTDPVRYLPLFDITSKASVEFCALQGLTYAPFVGIKRGDLPWHATFNRIPLFSDLMQEGFTGWAIYLDADAYVFDVRFDIRSYLAENSAMAMIGAPGGRDIWQANAGILLLNFGHPATGEIVGAWQKHFDELMPDERLLGMPDWPDGVPNDQSMLHGIMARRPDHAAILKLEPLAFMGHPSSSFIRQVLRIHGDLDTRLQTARAGVAAALERANAAEPPKVT